jgi:predicted ATPase
VSHDRSMKHSGKLAIHMISSSGSMEMNPDPLSLSPSSVAHTHVRATGDTRDDGTRIIGRASEIASLSNTLMYSGVRLVTLTGPTGVGKSRLAHAVAAEVERASRADVSIITMSDDVDTTSAVATVARTLRTSATGGASLIDAIASEIGSARLLLVLDDVQSADIATAIITPLIEICPAVAVLATSRHPLLVPYEIEFAVPPLVLTEDVGDVEALERDDAVAMFVDRARMARPDFRLTMAEIVSVAEICRRVGGNPLAIEIVAARVRQFPPDVILSRLERFRAADSSTPANDSHISDTGASDVVQWSLSLLKDFERRDVSVLSAFSGMASAEGVRWVLGEWQSPRTDDDAGRTDAITLLVDNALAQSVNIDGHFYFRLSEPVAAVVRDWLEQSGRWSEARDLHARWYAGHAERIEPHLRGADQQRWLTLIEREAANYRVALSWMIETGRVEQAIRTILSMGRFWASRSNVSEGCSWIERALSSALAVEPSWHGQALNLLSWLTLLRGRVDEARTIAEDSLAVFRSARDTAGEAGSLDSIGELALTQGDFATSVRVFRQSLRQWRALSDDWHTAMTLMSLGCAYLNLDDPAMASGCYQEALRLMEESSDRRGAEVARLGIAWMLLRGRNVPKATEIARKCLTLFRELDSPIEVAESLELLATIAEASGSRDAAARLLGGAEGMRRSIGVDAGFLSRMGYMSDRAEARARLQSSELEPLRRQGRDGTVSDLMMDPGVQEIITNVKPGSVASVTEPRLE